MVDVSYHKMAERYLGTWISIDVRKRDIGSEPDGRDVAMTTEDGRGDAVCDSRNVLADLVGDLLSRLGDAGLVDFDEAVAILIEARNKMRKAEGHE